MRRHGAHQTRPTVVLCLAIILSLLATSCAAIEDLLGDTADASAAEEPELLTADACDRITLTTDRAQPFERLAIDGWAMEPPTELAGPAPVIGFHLDGVDPIAEGLEFREVDGEDRDPNATPNLGWVHVHEPPTGPALDVPVHPLGDPDGGEVEVVFGQVLDDGEFRWCDERRALTIEPLPDADPAAGVTAWLDRTRETLATVLAQHGTSLDTLQQLSTDEVTDEEAPLYLAAQLLREDAVPEMVAQLDAGERELVDRMFTRADQLMDVEVAADGLAGPDDVTFAASTSTAPVTPTDVTVSPPAAAQLQLASLGAPSPSDGVWSPSGDATLQLASDGAACEEVTSTELETLMGRQFSGHTLRTGGPEALIDGTMFVSGLPFIGSATAAAGYTAWLTKVVGEVLAHTLPSRLEHSRLLVNTDELYEDDEDRGQVERVELRLSSDGWDPGPVVADLATMVSGQLATPGLQRYLRRDRRQNPRPGEPGTIQLKGETYWWDFDVMEETLSRAEAVAEIDLWVVSELMRRLIDAKEIDEGWYEFDPECWELDAPADEVEALDVDFRGAVEEGDEPLSFRPFDLGEGEIDAEINLAIGEHVLGLVSQDVRDMELTFAFPRTVEVLPLQVRWTPRITRAEPGDVVTFDLEVSNARDGRVDVFDDLDVLDVGQVDASGGTTIGYPVPTDWDESNPIQLEAMSISETGLRALDHPNQRGPITGSAFILPDSFPPLFIRPGVTCVDTGETWRFTAEDQPLFGNEVAVEWQADRGTIEPDGRFTAPDDAGPVTVRATALEDDDLTAELTFDVGSCDRCDYEIRIEGLLEGQDGVVLIPDDIDRAGRGITLGGVDWDTGTFERVVIGDDRLVLEVPDGASGELPGSFDVLQVTQDVTMYEYIPASDDGDPIPYPELWSGGDGPGAVGAPVQDWDPPSVSAQVQASGVPVDEDDPSLTYRMEIQGPLLVGREITDTGDGSGQFAMAEELIAEPLTGSISVTLEGVFRPDFDVRPPREDAGEDGTQGLVIEWDTDGDLAWCGGSRTDLLEEFKGSGP